MVSRVKIIGTKSEVWRGAAVKTRGGLTKKDLTISRSSGKIVSKKQQRRGHALAKMFPPQLTQAPLFTRRR